MRLALQLIGKGPRKVLVLHDWTTCRDSYEACYDALDPDRFTYGFVDLRGYGESIRVAGEMTADEVVGDLGDTADGLGWPEFALVGHSMSGVASLLAARRLQARVRALVLVTPVPARGVPVDPASRDMFASSATDDAAASQIAAMLTSGRLPSAWYRAKLARQRGTVAPTATIGYLDMWTKRDVSAEVGKLSTPTLVILGAHDFEFFRLESLRPLLTESVPGATYDVLMDAGHYPMAETPLRFVRLLEDFVGGAS